MATATAAATTESKAGARSVPIAVLQGLSIIWTLAWKEIRTYFMSFLAYALTFVTVFITWYLFLIILAFRPQDAPLEEVIHVLPQVFLFTIPLLTMRLLSEERSSGTMELLLTAPVTEWQVVLGKFFGALALVAFMVAATYHFPLIASRYGEIDWGPIKATYLATMLVAASFLAIGLFMSSLSDNQVVSGFLTFGALVTLLLIGNSGRTASVDWLSRVFSEIAIFSHLDSMVQGDVHSKGIIYYVSFTFFFLYCTVKSLESRKWR